jgi:tetratricopeptide (TPR) repeat protein
MLRKKEVLILLLILFSGMLALRIEAKSAEETYQEKSVGLKPDDIEGHYQLGLWCRQNKLLEQAKTQFSKVLELDPKHKKARQELENIVQLEKEAKISEIIKKYGPYKGVLDKPGADTEKLPWEKAREKEIDHFIIKTNLSADALNDICVLVECAYFTYLDLFGCAGQSQGDKLRVLVTKNLAEFNRLYLDFSGVNPSTTKGGYYAPASNSQNKSGQNHLLSWYNINTSVTALTRETLQHECTHYVIYLLASKYSYPQPPFIPPIWLNEGWATYCEANRLEGKRLVTNCINQWGLREIRKSLNKQTYIKLKDFINRSSAEYDDTICYSEGWSLIYFLLNGQEGKYKVGLQTYMEAWEKGKIVVSYDNKAYYPQDKTVHLKLFEESIGVPIDKLEEEWKKYILSLK